MTCPLSCEHRVQIAWAAWCYHPAIQTRLIQDPIQRDAFDLPRPSWCPTVRQVTEFTPLEMAVEECEP